ncbi:MAG: hypothetical protein ACXADW_22930 [Candidatus Hodarchaeales archaeon]|jgi:hypothetical protein
MSVSREYNHKKRSISRKKSKRKSIGVRLQYGKTMQALKRMSERQKFGKKRG